MVACRRVLGDRSAHAASIWQRTHLTNHLGRRLVYGSMAVHPGERGRIAAMLGRFRLTTLGVLGLVACTMFLASLYWTNVPPGVAAAPILTNIESGGVGLTRAEWNQRQGTVGDAVGSTVRHMVAPEQRALVYFMPEVAAPTQYVQRFDLSMNYVGAPQVSEDDGRALAMSLIPADSVFVRRTSSPVMRGRTGTTDFLTSESLARLYPTACLPERYSQSDPGGIRIWLQRDVNQPNRLVITVYWTCFVSPP